MNEEENTLKLIVIVAFHQQKIPERCKYLGINELRHQKFFQNNNFLNRENVSIRTRFRMYMELSSERMKLILQTIFVPIFMASTCISSNENDDDFLPSMVIVILVRNKAHTLPYFLTLLDEQDYDKSRLSLYIKSDHNQDKSSEILKAWIDSRGSEYHHVKTDINDEVYMDERPFEWDEKRFRRIIDLKEEALDYGRKIWADYLLFVDADVFLTNNQTFREFTARPEMSVSAPLLKTLSSYSNFWAGMTENFYYNRTDEYFPILDRDKVGCFEVPMVHTCVFINLNKVHSKSLTFNPEKIENQFEKTVPRDDIITFALSAKLANIKLHICNLERLSEFGYLMNPLEEEDDLLDDHDNLVNLKLQIIAQTKVLRPHSLFDPYLLPYYRRPDTLHMDQVYLINLKRRPDRYERMVACFKELGIDFKLIEAVDGKRITEKYLMENDIEPLPLFRYGNANNFLNGNVYLIYSLFLIILFCQTN